MSELREIPILPGVETQIDAPTASTKHYTYAEKIRFKNGLPEKIGGWTRLQYSQGDSISGVARSIFSYILNGFRRYLVGTNSHLYDVNGSDITNITPIQSITVAIPNSLDTDYKTLNNPVYTFTTVPNRVYILDAANRLELGDTVTVSGSTAVGGIPAGEINGTHIIREINQLGAYGYNTDTSATSNVFGGGGAAVVQRSGIVIVNAVAHGLLDGDRVKIASAATFGGITNVQLNLEHIIRNKTTNTFDIVTAGTATSSVTGGGGAATTYQKPIEAGLATAGASEGYGAGLYGAGLYGVSKRSSSLVPPRIWSHDRFGDLTVSCAGQQGDIYSWDAITTTAPVKVTNSPPANYVFVTDSIVVALGYDTGLATAKGNAISWSDQAGITNWTTGQSGSDTIEGAGDFISHASVRGGNLLFTQNQTYRFRYIGGQFTFQTVLLDPSVGIASQNARCVVDGVVYWMSLNNFYRWKGANIEVIPSNSSKECTILKGI